MRSDSNNKIDKVNVNLARQETEEGRGAMVRAWYFAIVAACRAVPLEADVQRNV